jgi:hypothetical protein
MSDTQNVTLPTIAMLGAGSMGPCHPLRADRARE